MTRFLTMLFVVAALAAVGGEYTIDLPEGGVNGRIAAIELSGEVLRNLGGHTAWLRLYDAEGNVVPYAREEAKKKETHAVVHVTPVKIDLVEKKDDGSLEILCHTATDAAFGENVSMHFETDMRDFGQNVQLFGKEEGGEMKPLPIDGKGYIFDSTSNIQARSLNVKFRPGRCHEFRILLSEADIERDGPQRFVSVTKGGESDRVTNEKTTVVKQPFSIKKLEIEDVVSEKVVAGRQLQSLSVPFVKVESGNGESIYYVNLDVFPVTGVNFKFKEENYSRKFKVWNMHDGSAAAIVCEGVAEGVSNGAVLFDGRTSATNGVTESKNTLESVREGGLQFTFEDNDNPPLTLEKISLVIPVYHLKFLVNSDKFPLKLAAVPNSQEPVYDVASVLSLEGAPKEMVFIHPKTFIGEPVGAGAKPMPKPFVIPRPVLYMAVLCAVVAMALAIAVTLKKSNEQPK